MPTAGSATPRARRVAVAAGVLAVAGAVALSVAALRSSPNPDDGGLAGGSPVESTSIDARVVAVVDGDTLLVDTRSDAAPVRVRLIGINTPESARAGVPAECGADRATSALAPLEGRRITLTTDNSQDRYDAYGRLLAYVTTTDGRDVGRDQLAAGLAREYTYRHRKYGRQNLYRTTERHAAQLGSGSWTTCT